MNQTHENETQVLGDCSKDRRAHPRVGAIAQVENAAHNVMRRHDHDDPINHPEHYTYGSIEVIDAIDAWQLGFALGNVVKYVARAGRKGNRLEDLRKAAWYLQHEIERNVASSFFHCAKCEAALLDLENQDYHDAVARYQQGQHVCEVQA